MKRIGLLGGMSFESTLIYYNLINKKVNQTLGGHYSPEILLLSLNFAEVEKLMHQNQWDNFEELLNNGAKVLCGGGADIIAICCNSAHKSVENIKKNIDIPFLHILDPTAKAIINEKIPTIGILGTKFVMIEDFYQNYLIRNFNLNCIMPNPNDQNTIHSIIYNELCQGIITEESITEFSNIIGRLQRRGAEGIVLACTELTLLAQRKNSLPVKLFDTTQLHIEEIVRLIINDIH